VTRSMPPQRETETVVSVRMSSRSALRQNAAEWDRESVLDLLVAPEWKLQAACRGKGTEAFVPEVKASFRSGQEACVGCTVRTECFEYALDHDDRFAVAGMTTPVQRRRFAAQGTLAELREMVAAGTVPLVGHGLKFERRRARYARAHTEVADQAIAMRNEGFSYREISEHLRVSTASIADWFALRRDEIVMRRRPARKVDFVPEKKQHQHPAEAEIIDLYRKGVAQQDIGDRVGLTRSAVRGVLYRYELRTGETLQREREPKQVAVAAWQMHLAGAHHRRIAKETGLSEGAVKALVYRRKKALRSDGAA
jgi:WhiB family transcriptional regulator, redox-sensing transcriptional regulator